ncbi:MAG: type II secretion system F family protein, partial [Planctomycetota bacterium]
FIFGIKWGWFGTLPMRLARRIPLIGKTIEALALSRFAWTMSISENAGMPALDIAKTSLEATQNYFYQRLVEPVQRSVQLGKGFSHSFRSTTAFPEDFLIYMENGEISGELAESMDRASKELQERAQNNLKTIGTIGFVLTFLTVAVIIGTVVITMAQQLYIKPIEDMLNQ